MVLRAASFLIAAVNSTVKDQRSAGQNIDGEIRP
jgi:hypothetical protein